MSPQPSSNAEMIRFWNEDAGAAWVAAQERLDLQVGPLGGRALARAGLGAATRALDVGCGCGGSTLEIARVVGDAGRVLGVDVSTPMLERARARAEAEGLASRIEWRVGDAQTAPLGEDAFDAAYSRFGVMFFEDPVAAFRNVARALRPGGRLAFVCWQGRERNPWMTAPALAAMKHVAFPRPPPPEAPGPFAFADATRVCDLLERAGFADVEVESAEEPMRLGGGRIDDALELFLSVGPVGAALRDAQAGPDLRARVLEAVREALESFRTPRGLEAPAAAWIVTAHRP